MIDRIELFIKNNSTWNELSDFLEQNGNEWWDYKSLIIKAIFYNKQGKIIDMLNIELPNKTYFSLFDSIAEGIDKVVMDNLNNHSILLVCSNILKLLPSKQAGQYKSWLDNCLSSDYSKEDETNFTFHKFYNEYIIFKFSLDGSNIVPSSLYGFTCQFFRKRQINKIKIEVEIIPFIGLYCKSYDNFPLDISREQKVLIETELPDEDIFLLHFLEKEILKKIAGKSENTRGLNKVSMMEKNIMIQFLNDYIYNDQMYFNEKTKKVIEKINAKKI